MNRYATKFLTFPLLTMFLFSAFVSCKKTESPPQTGGLYLHISSNVSGAKIDNTKFLSDSNSFYTFNISDAKFFISGITLTKENGTTYLVPNTYLLISAEGEDYFAGNVPAGTYSQISFNIGLDAAANAKAPYLLAVTGYSPAALMWHGNTSQGYKFFRLQGVCDTSVARTGKNTIPFLFEAGSPTDTLPRLNFPPKGGGYPPHPFTITPGGTSKLNMFCNYSSMLAYLHPVTIAKMNTSTIIKTSITPYMHLSYEK